MKPKRVGRIARPLLLAFLATCASFPATLTAQADTVSRVVDGFPDGTRLRVEVQDGARQLEGRLTDRTNEALILRAAEGRTTVRYSEIERLWTYGGHRGGQGALIGRLVGAGIGAGLVVVTFTSGDAPPPFETEDAAVLVGLATGALGAGIGYLGGRQQTDWRLRFEARDGRVGIRAEVFFP